MNSSKKLARAMEELVCNLNWFQLERLLFSVGFKFIIGISTCGREAIFGPLVTVGVILDVHHVVISKADFSKLNLEQEITHQLVIKSNNEINTVKNIDRVIRDSKSEMIGQIRKSYSRFVILTDWIAPKFRSDYLAIIRGNRYVYSLALSDRLAELKRQKLIEKMLIEHPEWEVYGLRENLGNSSKQHLHAIKKFGLVRPHRYYVS